MHPAALSENIMGQLKINLVDQSKLDSGRVALDALCFGVDDIIDAIIKCLPENSPSTSESTCFTDSVCGLCFTPNDGRFWDSYTVLDMGGTLLDKYFSITSQQTRDIKGLFCRRCVSLFELMDKLEMQLVNCKKYAETILPLGDEERHDLLDISPDFSPEAAVPEDVVEIKIEHEAPIEEIIEKPKPAPHRKKKGRPAKIKTSAPALDKKKATGPVRRPVPPSSPLPDQPQVSFPYTEPKCSFCAQTFVTDAELANHVAMHCDVCGHLAETKKKLGRHRNNHFLTPDQYKYACRHCEKKFRSGFVVFLT
jgi:hypothetical protein